MARDLTGLDLAGILVWRWDVGWVRVGGGKTYRRLLQQEQEARIVGNESRLLSIYLFLRCDVTG